MTDPTISVVTPTLLRPTEVGELLENLAQQTVLPTEVILVDGAEESENATFEIVEAIKAGLPFKVVYQRRNGGTAIQRNHGIELARGQFVAFVDDDVRLEPDFFETTISAFELAENEEVGGIVGYRTNQYFEASSSERWRWYKRLRLLSVYEPGRYDRKCGYPINNNMQAPFSGTREVDFVTTACAVWRREVFDSGLRFDEFFRDYGVLEDAHLSLRAGRDWRLLQCGDARCEELHSPNGRADRSRIGYKSVANYYYVFRDISGPLEFSQKYYFWRFQAFELFRIGMSAVRRRRWDDVTELIGRVNAIFAVLFGKLGIRNGQ